jgi:D-lactate dehydrogenase (cytochrome)
VTSAIACFRAALGDQVSTKPSVLEAHGTDENYPHPRPPIAVVFARSVADVRAALAAARKSATPVIAYGTGTSAEGRIVPVADAVTLDLSGMDRIIDVRPADFQAVVQPGVTRTSLNRALSDHGLFFPVDPGADASLGGMAATCASGTTTVRYGGMRANVAALLVVLASGETLRLGRPVRKTSSGYDLRDLFIGSGGTLGVITELIVNLHPVPEHVLALRVFFADVTAAAGAAYAVMAAALPVARLELVDASSMRALNRYLDAGLPELPALFVELHCSSPAALAAEAEAVVDAVRSAGATEVTTATTAAERSRLWEARHQLYWAVRSMFPGRAYVIGDTAVPLSAMPELVDYTATVMRELGLDGIIAGHAGDGNVHSVVAAPVADQRLEAFSDRVVERALALGGTCTGEHGIGLAKRKFLAAEHGRAAEWMRHVKQLFDPDGLLNPGKDV